MTQQTPSVLKSRAWTRVIFVLGILLTGIGLVEMILIPDRSSSYFASLFISMGFFLTLLSGLRLWRGESNYMQDERTKKIGAYGFSYSWFLTLFVLLGIFWADQLHLWSPDAGFLSMLLILLMGTSAIGFRVYLFRKGDVE